MRAGGEREEVGKECQPAMCLPQVLYMAVCRLVSRTLLDPPHLETGHQRTWREGGGRGEQREGGMEGE